MLKDRLACFFGKHLWDWEHDGRLMEARCQRPKCRRWIGWWNPRVARRRERRGTWVDTAA